MSSYQFFDDIPMDKTHALDQQTARFQGVKDGLPELVKNSKDQYARLRVVERRSRQIVAIANSKLRSIAVVDFAGATSEDFDGWTTWSSRTANRASLAQDIEGGFGNGGKSFMVRGAKVEAFMESCAQSLRTKMGFRNDKPSVKYHPGFATESAQRIKDLPEGNPKARLEAALSELGLEFADLPKPIGEAFEERQAFTIVRLDRVSDWEGRRVETVREMIQAIPEQLCEHGQAALTLETSSVWVVADGECITREPITANYPQPMSGFEDLQPIPVPQQILDPETNDLISTGRGDAMTKHLKLHVCNEQLRISDRNKAKNVIRIRNERNVVANWSLADLAPRAESAFIYGTLQLPELSAEHQDGMTRRELADTPLTRALRRWVAEQVDALAAKVQRALAHTYRQEDRDKANRALEGLRALMRQFLQPESSVTGEFGDQGDGRTEQEGVGNGQVGPCPREVGSEVEEIVLEPGLTQMALALGSGVPLHIRCYELTSDGRRLPVPNAQVELHATHQDVVSLDQHRVLRALSEGRTTIWVRSNGNGVESNRLDVEVLRCSGVSVTVPERELLQGEKVQIGTIFSTSSGPRNDLLIEGSVDESEAGRLSRSGWFVAGHMIGGATLRVRFGPEPTDTTSARVQIGPDAVPPRKSSTGEGGDIPQILMCGDTAPGMDDYPPEQRTHHGGEHYPTIIEEPQFSNVIWINPRSKEAMRVRQRHGGSSGVGRISSKSFLEFVALKCFEILKRLKVRQEVRDASLMEIEFRDRLAQAELECAGFIDAAYDLAERLYQGEEVRTA